MNSIIHEIRYLCGVARGCIRSYRSAHLLFKKYDTNDSFTRKILDKALLYIFFIPSLSFEYAQLISYKPTKVEIELLLYLSIFSILHDSLLDETPDGSVWLQNLLVSSKNEIDTDTPLQQITRDIYNKISGGSLTPLLRYVTEAQLYSQALSQAKQMTSTDVYHSLIMKGVIYPIYISPFNSELSAAETECFSFLGAWLQSTDDLSDAKQDMLEGIVTLATFEKGKYAREIEMALWSNFTERFSRLNYDAMRAKEFVSRMRLMGNIYKRYTAVENSVPLLKPLVMFLPLVFIWLPLCLVSVVEVCSVKIKHI
jgi:hypothetical protein